MGFEKIKGGITIKFTSAQSAKAIIFDFDGTIADSFDVFLEVLTAITKRQQQLSIQEVEDLRKYPTKEVIKRLGIKPWQVPLLLAKGRQEINARMEKVTVFEGMPEALRQLASKYSIYVLSTNSEENIADFLAKYQLDSHIDNVYGGIGLMSKAKSLKKLQKKEGLQIANCIYIGDETRDVEAARKVGMKSVAVKWGYNNSKILESHIPDALVDIPKDLPITIETQMSQAPDG